MAFSTLERRTPSLEPWSLAILEPENGVNVHQVGAVLSEAPLYILDSAGHLGPLLAQPAHNLRLAHDSCPICQASDRQ